MIVKCWASPRSAQPIRPGFLEAHQDRLSQGRTNSPLRRADLDRRPVGNLAAVVDVAVEAAEYYDGAGRARLVAVAGGGRAEKDAEGLAGGPVDEGAEFDFGFFEFHRNRKMELVAPAVAPVGDR